MDVTCFFCKKDFSINLSDPQYTKLQRNPESSYVCKPCNDSMQRDAQTSTGLHPHQIDAYNKYL
ncbi:DUF2197 domain-containing protein [Halobacillus litoralis]|uniref:DUF2197 domain-containing protein n=1 Tax=Halobacillus litoralis TaxID=45668 RepID=UPI001CD63020|nr:DUF2197 domain-containing protein [Halobacillus litoralis]MCA0970233.1 DUF2197 domain-containing protein [Halobacillus litoralis]